MPKFEVDLKMKSYLMEEDIKSKTRTISVSSQVFQFSIEMSLSPIKVALESCTNVCHAHTTAYVSSGTKMLLLEGYILGMKCLKMQYNEIGM